MANGSVAAPVFTRSRAPIPGDPLGLLQQLPPDEIADLCGVSRATASRWQRGKARVPLAAQKLIALRVGGAWSTSDEPRESARVRAEKLRARMLQFRDVYNGAYFVRMAQHGAPEYRREKVAAFTATLRRVLTNCRDEEALIYAVADALTAYPRGLPWDM